MKPDYRKFVIAMNIRMLVLSYTIEVFQMNSNKNDQLPNFLLRFGNISVLTKHQNFRYFVTKCLLFEKVLTQEKNFFSVRM